MKVAAVARENIFSPNMEEKDRNILLAVAEELHKNSAEVVVIEEGEKMPDAQFDAIYSMSRSSNRLSELHDTEMRGIPVLNSTAGITNSMRGRCIERLAQSNIPQPSGQIIDLHKPLPHLEYPLWIKHLEGWANEKWCVAYCADEASLHENIDAFIGHGATKALCSKHIEGDIVKFYGVKDSFFRYYHPAPADTKFGLETINGECQNIPFDTECLKATAFSAADAVGLDIFGGDAIISHTGEIYIIDINDFPSFSRYRKEAAIAIAEKILQESKPL